LLRGSGNQPGIKLLEQFKRFKSFKTFKRLTLKGPEAVGGPYYIPWAYLK
jgi:hypothetical protein